MNFSFHPLAEQELRSVVSYYEKCRPGLGGEFAQEVHYAIMRIVQYPDAHSPFSKNSRRCLLNRFPFGLLYTIQKENDMILILAVMNLHRNPDRWVGRN